MEYTLEQAQAHFEELVEKAAAGEEVLIVREDRPTVRLIAIDPGSEDPGSEDPGSESRETAD
jgi:prevent-host-death family protein